jgi:hypothetical protein
VAHQPPQKRVSKNKSGWILRFGISMQAMQTKLHFKKREVYKNISQILSYGITVQAMLFEPSVFGTRFLHDESSHCFPLCTLTDKVMKRTVLLEPNWVICRFVGTFNAFLTSSLLRFIRWIVAQPYTLIL